MGLRADAGEIWDLINFIYNFRDDVCGELKNDLEDSKVQRERLLDLCNSKEAVKLAENIEDQEKLLLVKKNKFRSSCRRMTTKLHKFLLYLESVGTESVSSGQSSGNGSREVTDSGGSQCNSRVTNFRGIEFRNMDSFEITEDNMVRMDGGHSPVGKDGLYVELHHSLQTEDGPIWEVAQTKHTKWHRAIHINPSSMPSGINRSAFAMLREDYWKYRAAIIRRGLGG